MRKNNTVVIGTGNKDKLRELKGLLKGSKIRVLSLKDFPKCPDVVENGKTFEANAQKKARQYSKHTGCLTLADDSGLSVSYLNGKPGVYSARFAGVKCSYDDNNKKLLRLLKGLPAVKRKAKFVCIISIYDKGKHIKTVRGECHGTISTEVRGNKGFGYDPVFIPKGQSKTYAELGPKFKSKVSHRGRALRAAKKALFSYL